MAQGSRKLNYFLSVSVINPETEAIMERAMQQFDMAAVPPWPGKDFEFAVKGNNPSDADLAEMEAALALLGMSHNRKPFLCRHLTSVRLPQRSRCRVLPHSTPPSAWLEVHLEDQNLDGRRGRVGEPKYPALRVRPRSYCGT